MQGGSYRYNSAERQTFLAGYHQEKLAPGLSSQCLNWVREEAARRLGTTVSPSRSVVLFGSEVGPERAAGRDIPVRITVPA